jgi:hypothetical protein
MLTLTTALTSSQVKQGDPWDLIYVPVPKGATVRMHAEVRLTSADGCRYAATVEDVAHDDTIGVELLSPAALRQQAARELAAEFGTPVEEWLV